MSKQVTLNLSVEQIEALIAYMCGEADTAKQRAQVGAVFKAAVQAIEKANGTQAEKAQG